MAQRPKVGDVYQIPLPDGRFAFAQYLQWNEEMGCLIRVFDFLLDHEPESLAALKLAGEMFPPVFAGLKAAVKADRWKRIGSMPVPNFTFPTFRCTSATKPGTYENWWLWDGGAQRFIGKLPEELRSLEVEVSWGYELLEERIATGKNLFAKVV